MKAYTALSLLLLLIFHFEILAEDTTATTATTMGTTTVTVEEAATTTTTDEEKELTAEEMRDAENYFHHGLSQRTMEEECTKLDDSRACQGNGKTKFMGIDSNTIQMANRAYALVVGALSQSGGGKFQKYKLDKNGEKIPGENGKNQTENRENYCSYIAIGTEGISMFQQSTVQKTMQAEAMADRNESQQRQQLYQAARAHESRAKTAQFQAVGWGTTAACYSYYMYLAKVKGTYQASWQLYMRLGAAAFLSGFYLNEAKSHSNYADEVRGIAKKLPSTGDCNPHTDTTCYCAQPETMYDSNYCNLASTGYQIPCLDQNLNSDPACECKKTNSCYDSNNFNDDLYGQFLNSGAGQDLKDLSNSNFNEDLSVTEEKVNNVQNVANALGKDLKIPEQFTPNDLNVKSIESQGLSGNGARVLALGASQVDPDAAAEIKAESRTSISRKASKIIKSAQSGSGADLSTSKTKSSKVDFSFLNNLGKKKNRSPGSEQILEFGQLAQEKADISQDKDIPIWDILHNRFQNVQGEDHLDVSIKDL